MLPRQRSLPDNARSTLPIRKPARCCALPRPVCRKPPLRLSDYPYLTPGGNPLVHHGGGSTAALLDLAREVRDGVEARFGVRLVPEPTLLGVSFG